MVQPSLQKDDLFNYHQLKRLLIPLLVEQFLIVFFGFSDTFMVSTAGSEAAVSAVSLVDNINVLVNQAFTALATGGSVIAAQYLGKQDRENACQAAEQLFMVTTLVTLVLGLIMAVFNTSVLYLIFGRDLEPEVVQHATTYMIISALTYPFIGLFSAGSAMFRSMGNSKTTMLVSLMMTIVKVALNAITIYFMKLGVIGAAVSTLIARIVSAGLYLYWIKNPYNMIYIPSYRKIRLRPDLIKRILIIGVPNGIENSLFQMGKLLTLNLVTGLGTAATAANAIASSICGLFQLPGNAVSLALITIVGQCMGARQPERAAALTKKLVLISVGMLTITQFMMCLLIDPLLTAFNASSSAHELGRNLLFVFAPMTVVIWSISFVLPNCLRAAGDVRATMIISMISMWTFRVGLSYVLVKGMGFGVDGVWYAMYADWLVRAIWFSIRFQRGKWKTLQLI